MNLKTADALFTKGNKGNEEKVFGRKHALTKLHPPGVSSGTGLQAQAFDTSLTSVNATDVSRMKQSARDGALALPRPEQ
jgi:hypothetical protein